MRHMHETKSYFARMNWHWSLIPLIVIDSMLTRHCVIMQFFTATESRRLWYTSNLPHPSIPLGCVTYKMRSIAVAPMIIRYTSVLNFSSDEGNNLFHDTILISVKYSMPSPRNNNDFLLFEVRTNFVQGHLVIELGVFVRVEEEKW